ncbi:PD-(D/E)XK nuclease family protein [Lysinibacillus fusiformis]|uniref:PD-(D/E)XK nuclease family protein n=1 Tax=Lysinibacillus fusiformis TaxID=28031 RepID=UPI003D08D5DE
MVNLAFSATRLITYEDCPFMFYKRVIKKEENGQTLPLALGSATHLAIELILKGVSKYDAVVKAFREYEIDELKIKDIMDLVDNAPYQQFMRAAIEIEKKFRLPLDETGEYEVTGVIDVADTKGYFLADWKTNRKVYTPTDTRQLALYAWALGEMQGKREILATLYFLRFYKQQRQSHLFTYWEMQEARIWALKLTKEINKKNQLIKMFEGTPYEESTLKANFPAKPSNRCSHCPFSVECFGMFSDFS